MRCRTCEYELWNLVPGSCPECGTPWRYEEYRFRVGAAQFFCPHCEHAYSGNDAAGLPAPRTFQCAQCQQDISLASMRALPAPGINRDDAMEDRHPWMDRARLGRWRAFRQMTRRAITTPTALGAALPANLTMGGPLLFSLLCNAVWIGGCVVLPMLALFVFELSGSRSSPIWTAALPMLVCGLVVIVGFQVAVIAWALIAHLIVRATGETAHGWRHTVAALLFASAPMVYCAVPCCGAYLGVIGLGWISIAGIFALVGAQKISAGRAAAAVMLPVVASVLVVAGVATWGIWSVTRIVNPVTTTLTPAPPSNAQMLPAP